jgi:UDP-N-acetylglucosamine--N-acetylmuramyl-(pentapeptide) pyrophosphoryl-undecaprenol N-acetylglucosamine transferase
VYPALAVVERIRDQGSGIRDQDSTFRIPHSEILWIGGQGGVEEALVKRAGIEFAAIPAGGLHGVALIKAVKNGLKLIAGTFQALRLIGRWRPEVLLTTGGFVSGPMAVACWLRRVPIVVYLPDIEPGRAVKFVAWFASKIAVTVDESRKYFPADKTIVTGYPTRAAFAQADRPTALRHFDLDPQRQTLLVFGGSKGARSINRALGQIAGRVLVDHQIIHITGSSDIDEVRGKREALPDELKSRYHVFEYVHEMGLAFAAADLVVSRAGASILGEYPLFGLPSILIPYPYAWRYQRVNAALLVARGAALQLDDATLNATLLPAIERLMNDEAQLETMRAAARALARPDPARAVASVLEGLIGAAA